MERERVGRSQAVLKAAHPAPPLLPGDWRHQICMHCVYSAKTEVFSHLSKLWLFFSCFSQFAPQEGYEARGFYVHRGEQGS